MYDGSFYHYTDLQYGRPNLKTHNPDSHKYLQNSINILPLFTLSHKLNTSLKHMSLYITNKTVQNNQKNKYKHDDATAVGRPSAVNKMAKVNVVLCCYETTA